MSNCALDTCHLMYIHMFICLVMSELIANAIANVITKP